MTPRRDAPVHVTNEAEGAVVLLTERLLSLFTRFFRNSDRRAGVRAGGRGKVSSTSPPLADGGSDVEAAGGRPKEGEGKLHRLRPPPSNT